MLLDVPLEHALSDVDGAHQMAGLELMTFTHVKHHQWLTVGHHRSEVVRFAFNDVASSGLDDGEESRAVFLGHDFR